jgi:HSP20 family protein
MNSLLSPRTKAPLARREMFGPFFDDFFDDAWMRPGWMPMRMFELPTVARARMDVVDKGGAFEITVDLPGVKKEDINVSVEGDRVSISAEMHAEKEVKDGEKLLHTERIATSYGRSFELPAEVTETGAEARYENGVLRLTLPKRAPTAGKRLAIK